MNLTTRTARRLIVSAAVACAAIALPASAVAAPRTAAGLAGPQAPAVAPPCETPGLVIWFNTHGSGTLGSVFYHLEFTNLSGHSCTLNGFPFLFAIDLHGHQVGSRAAFGGGPPHVITIGNGRTANALLQVVDVGVYPPSVCHPVTAAGFRVFPPNQTRSKDIPFPFGACSRFGTRFLIVRPVK